MKLEVCLLLLSALLLASGAPVEFGILGRNCLGALCDIYCPWGMADAVNGCQPCACKASPFDGSHGILG